MVISFGRGKVKVTRGNIDVTKIGIIDNLSRKIHRGIIEIHGDIETCTLDMILQALTRIPEGISNAHIIIESYTVNVSLYILIRGNRIILIASGEILRNRDLWRSISHLLDRIGRNNIKSIRMSFLRECNPQKIVEFVKEVTIRDGMDVQLSGTIIDTVMKHPEFLNAFRRLRVYLSTRNIVSIDRDISTIEVFHGDGEVGPWEKILVTGIQLSKKARHIDISVDEPDRIIKILAITSELQKNIDSIFVSSEKIRIVNNGIPFEIVLEEWVQGEVLQKAINEIHTHIEEARPLRIIIRDKQLHIQEMVR